MKAITLKFTQNKHINIMDMLNNVKKVSKE